VVAAPAAIAASLSAGARHGLLLKGGAVLEALGKITVAAFDKTGTLTQGKPKVTDIVAIGRTQAQVLRLAAALETGSSHPLAIAIMARATEEGLDLPPATDIRASAVGHHRHGEWLTSSARRRRGRPGALPRRCRRHRDAERGGQDRLFIAGLAKSPA
jgi:cation transport ATPase